MKSLLSSSLLLLLLAISGGLLRQEFNHGISFFGKWPTSSTGAEEAYRMLAQPGDPPFVGLDEVIQLQESNGAVFLDARTSAEFSNGHIPGARNLPYYEIDAYQERALGGLSSDTLVVLYCEGIGCELSFFLGRELAAAGYTNTRIFYGGYPEWSEAGLPVEK